MRRLIAALILLIIFLWIFVVGIQYMDRVYPWFGGSQSSVTDKNEPIKVVSEESVIIDVVKKVSPSVVTIAIPPIRNMNSSLDPFSFFDLPNTSGEQDETSSEPLNIGSGFIISTDGLIVTNKHVVSDSTVKYTVITNNAKKYDVVKVYRDPLNDIAIIKIAPTQNKDNKLLPVQLGDSSRLQVGQLTVAIGTPLGQFNNTVTSGIISGLGRGITAGSIFEGVVEQLDNVIQTDAAINPGNSGGPLLNSSGEVIGVNTAVSESGQNIGFALPINSIKDSVKNFNETGQFNRAFLGIAYKIIGRDLAIANNLPEGGYIQTVVEDSAADKAGLRVGDIVTKVNGEKIAAKTNEISAVVSKKKPGDILTLTIYREDEQGKGSILDIDITLGTAPES